MIRLICLLLLFAHISILAQTDDDSILFIWDDTLYAQPINGGEVIQIGTNRNGFEFSLPAYDVYSRDASPLTDLPLDGFGFHHGIWSDDRTRFAYIELNPPQYRVRLIQADDNRILLDSTITSNLGYLDPIAWTETGDLLLLERVALNHLHQVNIFQLDTESGVLDFYTSVMTGHLVGRTALLPDGFTVFLGFDLTRNLGVLLDTKTRQVQNFAIRLNTMLPLQKGFEYYPLQVYGALNRDNLIQFAQALSKLPQTLDDKPLPQPFLHWALADHRRYITCYADSEWTYSSFDTNCPGLGGHNYVGHQGTDVSAEPDGLPIGTPVYPSAVGTIVASYRNCLGQNPSCNQSYGNTLTMEHILIVDGETQVWYTGYGHLQMVVPDDGTYVDDFTQAIALSGATGVGGAHLHFEVRTSEGWFDPWEHNLWIGDTSRPTAQVMQDNMETVPKILDVCLGYAGNNIRSGAGTTFRSIGKTLNNTTYYVTDITYVSDGDAIGEWYQVLSDGVDGWLWSGTLSC